MDDFNILNLDNQEIANDIMTSFTHNEIVKKKEKIKEIEPSEVGNTVLNLIGKNIHKNQEALDMVLEVLSSTPDDTDLISSVSSLINAQKNLISEMNKIYLQQEKFRENIIITKLKNESENKINEDSNSTKITINREQIIAELMKRKKKEEEDPIIIN